MGGGGRQRGGLFARVRAHLPQAVQQAGHGARMVEAGVGGGIAGQQRGGLSVRADIPQAGQQAEPRRRGRRGDVGGGVAGQQPPGWSCARISRSSTSRPATAAGWSRGTWAAARAASAAAWSCAPILHRLPTRQATASGLSRGTWVAGSRASSGGLLVRARLPQAAQQAEPRRTGRRGGRGRRGRGPAARRPVRARPSSAGCPAGRPRRPGGRGGRGRRDRGPAAAAWSCAPISRRLLSRRATAYGSSRVAWAAAGAPARRPVRARPPTAGCPAVGQRRPGGRGRRGRRPSAPGGGPRRQSGGSLR